MTIRLLLGLCLLFLCSATCYSRDEFSVSRNHCGEEMYLGVVRGKTTPATLDSLERKDTLSRWHMSAGIHGSRLTTKLKDYISGFSIQYKTKVTWRMDLIVPYSNFLNSTLSKNDTTAFLAVPSVTAQWNSFEFKLSLMVLYYEAPGTDYDIFYILPIPSLKFQLGENDFYMTIDLFRVDMELVTNIEQAIIGIGTNSADLGTQFWVGAGYTVPFLFKDRFFAFYAQFRYSISRKLGLSINAGLSREVNMFYAGVDFPL